MDKRFLKYMSLTFLSLLLFLFNIASLANSFFVFKKKSNHIFCASCSFSFLSFFHTFGFSTKTNRCTFDLPKVQNINLSTNKKLVNKIKENDLFKFSFFSLSRQVSNKKCFPINHEKANVLVTGIEREGFLDKTINAIHLNLVYEKIILIVKDENYVKKSLISRKNSYKGISELLQVEQIQSTTTDALKKHLHNTKSWIAYVDSLKDIEEYTKVFLESCASNILFIFYDFINFVYNSLDMKGDANEHIRRLSSNSSNSNNTNSSNYNSCISISDEFCSKNALHNKISEIYEKMQNILNSVNNKQEKNIVFLLMPPFNKKISAKSVRLLSIKNENDFLSAFTSPGFKNISSINHEEALRTAVDFLKESEFSKKIIAVCEEEQKNNQETNIKEEIKEILRDQLKKDDYKLCYNSNLKRSENLEKKHLDDRQIDIEEEVENLFKLQRQKRKEKQKEKEETKLREILSEEWRDKFYVSWKVNSTNNTENVLPEHLSESEYIKMNWDRRFTELMNGRKEDNFSN